MRLRLAVVAAVAVVLAALSLRPTTPGGPLASPVPPARPALPRTTARPPAAPPATDPAARAPWQLSFAERTARVREDCGLEVGTRCEGDACVALAVGPDLDRFSGWMELLLSNPAFVLSTAARDLGVPPRALPCGAAIAALGSGQTAAVELADGTEVWCLPTDAGGRTRWDDGQRALCDAAAEAAVGPEAARFDTDHLRILRFDR